METYTPENTISNQVNIQSVLMECFRHEIIGDISFFENYFKTYGNGYFFLFKKNLRVTNIQFAELVSLLKKYSHSDLEQNVGSKFHFFTAQQFNNTVRELMGSYTIDANDPDAISSSARHFAETYYSLFQHIVVMDPYYTSCSVFIPPSVQIDLKMICGVSGYIHSCGSHIYVRNINKCSHVALLDELGVYLRKNSVDNQKKLFFTIYAHEDFGPDDQSFQEGSRNGLQEVKIYEEKCFMGPISLVKFIDVLQQTYPRISVPKRGPSSLHKAILEEKKNDLCRDRTLWLIMDKKINMNNMTHPDDTSYYICYEQRYMNANQFQLFDENKIAWKSNTTLPHSLCSAMLNMALQSVPNSQIEICDPFLGSGTTFFEAQKFPNVTFSGFDLDFLSKELFDYNLSFFLKSRDDLSRLGANLISIKRQIDTTDRKMTGNLEKRKIKIEALLGNKYQGEYEFGPSQMIDIRNLDEEDKILFFMLLRTKIKYGNEFIRKGYEDDNVPLAKEITKFINSLDKYQTLYDRARANTLDLNQEAPDLVVWQGEYSENISIDKAKFRRERIADKFYICCGTEGNVSKLPEGRFDVIVTDPPYGFNTLDETIQLGTFYNEFLEKLICGLKDNGQLLICLPEKSFSGKMSPFFTHKEIVFNRVLSICNKRRYELVDPIYMVPNRELFRPPFYWNAEKALSRSILHFRIRHPRTEPPTPSPGDLRSRRKQAIFIIGPSGSGKTTLANYLRNELGYKKVSGGDLIRKIEKKGGESPDAIESRRVVATGGAANDDLIIRLYTEHTVTSKPGIVFDGNPSGEVQANAFVKLLNDRHFDILIIKLECSLRTCMDRARTSPQPRTDKNKENIANRHQWYETDVMAAYNILRRRAEVLTVNAHKTVFEIREEVMRGLSGTGIVV